MIDLSDPARIKGFRIPRSVTGYAVRAEAHPERSSGNSGEAGFEGAEDRPDIRFGDDQRR